ncbi:hypothetical protein OBK20_04630 [Empedobacter falsenii]
MSLNQLKKSKYRNYLFLLYFLVFHVSYIYSQNSKINTYNKKLVSNNNFSYQKIKNFSKSNNTYNFMALGYFINANNNMYIKTGDVKYLDNNLNIIKPILVDNSVSNYKYNNWKMNVPSSNQNAVVNGQEHLISEGYFFRYVGEFLDIICQKDIYTNYHTTILDGLKYSFTKWRERSFEKYNDYSLLFHQRLHTGANWAIVALYLNKYDTNNTNDYKTFINQFDDQLAKALTLKSEYGNQYYIWNSTYPEKFCAALKNIKNYKPVIQDVSHGNHVVLYLLKTKELSNPNWKNFNFEYLINTLKLKILKNSSITDNVDGSTTPSVKNTGWKVSDGWYKLIYKDQNLKPLFDKSLNSYQKNISNSSLELQFNSIY